MKFSAILTCALGLLPAALNAQENALAQLGGPGAPAAAEAPVAVPDKGTQVLFDPAAGKAHVVIPVGGGFIYAQTGKFQPAVFNGSGYALPDENGAVAGSYANGSVVLKEAYSETVDILTTIRVDGPHFGCREVWTQKNGRELYVITGRLFTGG